MRKIICLLLLILYCTSPLTQAASGFGYLRSEEDPERRVEYQGEAHAREPSRQDKLATYRSLQETCQRWRRWHAKDQDPNSAVQMNVACRKAAEYGRKELGLKTSAKRVNPDSYNSKNSSGGSVILIENPKAKIESAHCQSLRRELEHIQSRLRAGYKVPEGERLKKRRRAIREELQQHC